ncbi:MAG: hypothetical protein QXH87_01590 [Candidatus Bathyarchaeia archaeon]
MYLAEIIKDAIKRVSAKPGIEEKFKSFEGEKIALKLKGDKAIVFKVQNGIPTVTESEVEVQNANAIAEVEVEEFVKFVDGNKHFASLFSMDLKEIFKAERGEFYDFGGDFMLLGPMLEELTNIYKEDPDIRNEIEKYKGSR